MASSPAADIKQALQAGNGFLELFVNFSVRFVIDCQGMYP